MKKNQIVVYGTGEMAMFLASRAHPHTEIIAYLDSTRFDEYIDKIPIIAEHSLRDLDYDYVIIAFGDIELGKKKLIDLGVDESIIGAYNYSHNSNTYKQMLVQFQTNFFESNNHKIVLEYFDVIPTKYFLSTMRVSSELYPFIESDYVREMTLALISEQIYKKT